MFFLIFLAALAISLCLAALGLLKQAGEVLLCGWLALTGGAILAGAYLTGIVMFSPLLVGIVIYEHFRAPQRR